MDLQEEKKKQVEAQRRVLTLWHSTLKMFHLYSAGHPSVLQAVQNFIEGLNDVFKGQVEICVDHTNGIFVIEDTLFIEESIVMFDLLSILEEMKIASVIFLSGVTSEELIPFFQLLLKSGGSVGKAREIPKEGYTSVHVRVVAASSRDTQIKAITEAENLDLAGKEYNGWVDRIEGLFTKMMDEQTFSFGELSVPLESLYDHLIRDSKSFSILVTLRPASKVLFEHALNSMIISMYIGHQLGVSPGIIKQLAVSALFHDLGRHFLPSEMTAQMELTEEDKAIIQLHSRDGAVYLLGVAGLPVLAVRVALEHHVGLDRKGYPNLPAVYNIHYFSHIVGLADFISWRTVSERYYHKPVSMGRLVRALLRRAGSQFDPFLVKLVLPFFGFYPPGSRVCLVDGQEAVVLAPTIKHVLRPEIVVRQPSCVKLVDLTEFSHMSADPYLTEIKMALGSRFPDERVFAFIHEQLKQAKIS